MPVGIQLAIAFAVGCLCVGLILFIRWWLNPQRRGIVALANSRDEISIGQESLISELRQQIARHEGEIAGLRGRLMETESNRATAEAGKYAAEKILAARTAEPL